MSSNAYATPLYLEVFPSRIAACLLLFTHIAAIICVMALPFPMVYLLSLSAMSCVSCWMSLKKLLLLSEKAIIRLVWKPGNDWIMQYRNGSQEQTQLLPSSYIHPALTVLNFKTCSCSFTRSVVLLQDNIERACFRRLRVRLKIERQHFSG